MIDPGPVRKHMLPFSHATVDKSNCYIHIQIGIQLQIFPGFWRKNVFASPASVS